MRSIDGVTIGEQLNRISEQKASEIAKEDAIRILPNIYKVCKEAAMMGNFSAELTGENFMPLYRGKHSSKIEEFIKEALRVEGMELIKPSYQNGGNYIVRW